MLGIRFGRKDGGPESKVYMYGIEIKWLFSILLLRFDDGGRDVYHSHAFNCFSWLWGWLVESHYKGGVNVHRTSWKPFITRRTTFHKVKSIGRSWVLTFRGPWTDLWEESGGVVLTHGRKEL